MASDRLTDAIKRLMLALSFLNTAHRSTPFHLSSSNSSFSFLITFRCTIYRDNDDSLINSF
jgi:hypothetical protein